MLKNNIYLENKQKNKTIKINNKTKTIKTK